MRKDWDFSDLRPGLRFFYHGPREFPFFRRGFASACVIGVSPESGIVHVRTYRDAGENLAVQIAHLPLLYSAFRKSVFDLGHRVDAIGEGSWESLNLWRRRSRQGEVGGFREVLWRAERHVLETVQEGFPAAEIAYVAWGFPKRDPETGRYSIIEVEIARKPG